MFRQIKSGLFALLCVAGMEGEVYAADMFNGTNFPVVAKISAQLGHSMPPAHLAFSPDNRTIVSSGWDKTIIWDVDSGRELRTLDGSGGDVGSNVAISPDGRTIVSGSLDNSLKIWEAASGRELHSLKGNEGINSVAYSPDGRTIVAGICRKNVSGNCEYQVILLDVTNDREIFTMKGDHVGERGVAISPDGRTIISNNGRELKLWDASSGRELGSRKFNNLGDLSAFSPDGRMIASIDGKTIQLWDGHVLRTLRGHSDKINHVAFSPDGRTIVSSDDKIIKLWDATSGRELHSLDGRSETIVTVAFSNDGRTIATGNWGNFVRLWDVATGQELITLRGHVKSVQAIAVSPDGHTLVSGDAGSTLPLWDQASGRELRTLRGHGKLANCVAYSPDGKIIVSGSADNTIKLWDAANGRELFTLSGHVGDVKSVAYSPDGRIIASGSKDKTIKLWDIASRQELLTIKGHSNSVNAIAFSPDGRTLVSGSGSFDNSFENEDLNINRVPLPKDYTVRIWDASTGRELYTLRGHSDVVTTVAFSPDGRTIVSAGDDKTIKLWDAFSGHELKTLNESSTIEAVAFSPDGRTLVSAGLDHSIKILEISSGQILRILSGHSFGVSAVAFSQDGKNIFSASWDGTVRKWDVATGKEIAQFVSFDDGEWVTITPEGYYDASEHGDKYLNVRIGNNVFGIDQYRESFYRPDLVKIALSGDTIKEFRNIASVKPAPQVQFVDTPQNTSNTEVSVKLKLTDMGGGIGHVRLYLNGSAVVLDNSRALKRQDDGTRTYTVKLTNGKNSIRAIAFNADNSMQSMDALYEISASFKVAGKPNLHAVVVGIQEFKNPKLNLEYPVADADLFAATLQKSASGLFGKVEIIKLTTKEQTTSENIKKELSALHSLNPDDLFVFYVASHGTVDDGEYFLITSNVGLTSTEHLRADALPQNEMKELIANIPTTKKVIVLDTCNSGALGDALQRAMLTRGMSEDTAIKILSRAVGSTILSASTSTQEALEGYKGHGLFTYVLAEGLSGKADKGKSGYIKTTDLVDYVDTEVPDLADKVFKRAQYPTNNSNGQGFDIGKVPTP